MPVAEAAVSILFDLLFLLLFPMEEQDAMKTLLFHQLGKQILLCLQVPKAVVRLADVIQLGKQRVFFSGLGKVANGGKGQLNIGVNQLFARRGFWADSRWRPLQRLSRPRG